METQRNQQNFFDYMRQLLKLQLILYENITDIYKSDYNWDQHTSMLMERCPNFNHLKYSRDVYSSHLSKGTDCLHSNLIKKENTPTMHCENSNCCSPSWRAAAPTTRPLAEWLKKPTKLLVTISSPCFHQFGFIHLMLLIGNVRKVYKN